MFYGSTIFLFGQRSVSAPNGMHIFKYAAELHVSIISHPNLIRMDRWTHRQDFAPVFTGGPYAIWGLTGYILHRFVKDILAPYRVHCPQSHPPNRWAP